MLYSFILRQLITLYEPFVREDALFNFQFSSVKKMVTERSRLHLIDSTHHFFH